MTFFVQCIITATASEPELNKRGSSLISRRLHYRGLQSLFLTKSKELWLCANGRFRMRSEPCAFLSLLFFRSFLGYLKDSNAAAHSVDSDLFYIVINVSVRSKSYIYNLYFLK